MFADRRIQSAINYIIVIAFMLVNLPPMTSAQVVNTSETPNVLFVFSDDHSVNAISSYGGIHASSAPTPNIDRIAKEGALFVNSLCANSICGPSRACILTGLHSHKNGFMRNSRKPFDQEQWTFPKSLKEAGYQNAVVGKWHLKSDPVGFDFWEVLPGQGNYYNPVYLQMDGSRKKFEGYVTDITTDKSIAWLERRDPDRPFFLMCQYKAPHRTFSPALRHLGALDNVDITEPATLFDDYTGRSNVLKNNEMEIDRHLTWAYDLKVRDDELDGAVLPSFRSYGTPEYKRMTSTQRQKWDDHFRPRNKKFIQQYKSGAFDDRKLVSWKYQRYVRNYLETVRCVDENVGKLLKYLDDNRLAENTIVIYCSDQGFYLGEHGWFDKRWMFEESLKMPFVIRWPGKIEPGSRPEAMIQNIDYAPTFMQMVGLKAPASVQGESFLPVLTGQKQSTRDSIYYAYYEVGEHAVPQHFGVRTKTHKLFYLPATKEWQMFDLQKDPHELKSVYNDPKYRAQRDRLVKQYEALRRKYDAPEYENGG